MSAAPRILHLHASFDPGDSQLRTVKLINGWRGKAVHSIVSGDPDRIEAAGLLDKGIQVFWPPFPSLSGKPTPGRLRFLAERMSGYDLICSYNWGAIDAALAHTLFADLYELAPLVHHEDGLDADEIRQPMLRRNFYRRIALGRTSALVVPSRRMESIALETWKQPRTRVQRIANGIDTRALARPVSRDALPGLIKRKGEFWIGAITDLHEGNELGALVRLIERLPSEWNLVLAGDGPERDSLLQLAVDLEVEDRVHLPGTVENRETILRLLDILALSSLRGQLPVSVIEAMAAGLPVIAPREGEIGSIVASENGPLLSDPGDEQAMMKVAWSLTSDPQMRKRIGKANRDKARSEFDEREMIERYRALYWGLMNRKGPGDDQ